MADDVRSRALDVLHGRRDKALFLSELDACLTEDSSTDVAHAVAELDGSHVLVLNPRSPDPHFTGDLRIVALLDPTDPDRPRRSAEQVWSRWFREVLAHHRCG